MIGTKASVTWSPQISPTSSAPLSKTKLLTAGCSPLPCFGARVILLRFGSRHYSWSFQLAPVSVPILGSDFLCHHALLVDVARARARDSLDILSTVSSPAASDLFCAHLQQAPREIGNSCQSTQMSSLPMVFWPLHPIMNYSATCPQLSVCHIKFNFLG